MNRKLLLASAVASVFAVPLVNVHAQSDEKPEAPKPELILSQSDEKPEAPKPELILSQSDEKPEAPKPELIADGDGPYPDGSKTTFELVA